MKVYLALYLVLILLGRFIRAVIGNIVIMNNDISRNCEINVQNMIEKINDCLETSEKIKRDLAIRISGSPGEDVMCSLRRTLEWPNELPNSIAMAQKILNQFAPIFKGAVQSELNKGREDTYYDIQLLFKYFFAFKTSIEFDMMVLKRCGKTPAYKEDLSNLFHKFPSNDSCVGYDECARSCITDHKRCIKKCKRKQLDRQTFTVFKELSVVLQSLKSSLSSYARQMFWISKWRTRLYPVIL